MLIRLLLSIGLVTSSLPSSALAAWALPQSDQDKLFADAVQDYNSNRFPKAQEEFSQIQGSHAQEAQDYLNKIKTYMDAMETADDIMRRPEDELDPKSLDSAIGEYNRAIMIKHDGPGMVARKLANANKFKDRHERAENQKRKDLCDKFTAARDRRQEAADYACQLADSDPAYLCGSDEAAKLCKQYTISAISPEPSPAVPKEPSGPKESLGKHSEMLKEASADYEHNDFQGARAVLASIRSDPAAKDYLDKISSYQSDMAQAKLLSKESKYEEARTAYAAAADIKADGPNHPRSLALQMELFEGVDQFYSNDYPAAIQHLEDYIQGAGEKQALAQFYLGASELARYFLGGNEDGKLQGDALGHLREAKHAGFIPDSQEVSPAILQVYKSLAADSPPATN